MEEYIKALEGISYLDWVKLRMAVDRTFDLQKGESEKMLKLTDPDAIAKLIQLQTILDSESAHLLSKSMIPLRKW